MTGFFLNYLSALGQWQLRPRAWLGVVGFLLISADGWALTEQAKRELTGLKWNLIDAFDNTEQSTRTLRFERVALIYKTIVPVASVTHTIVKRKNGEAISAAAAQNEANKAFDLIRSMAKDKAPTSLETDFTHRTFTLKVDWQKQNRFIQVVYRDFGDRYVVSTSMIRRLYMFPAGFEAHALQMALLENTTRKVGALERIKNALWVQKAFAVGNQLTLNLPGGLGSVTGSPDVITNFLGRLNTGAGTLRGTLNGVGQDATRNALNFTGGVTNQVQTLSSNVMNEAQGRVQTLWNNVNRDIRGQVDYASNRVQQVGSQLISESEGAISRQLDHANAIVRQQTSNSNILRMAFMAGVGGAAGAAAANIILDAAASGASWVADQVYRGVFALLSEEQKRIMTEAAGQALTDLRQASEQLAVLETQLDLRIAALDLLTGVPPESLAETISISAERAKGFYAYAEAMRNRNPADWNAITQCDYYRRHVTTFEALQSFLVSDGGTREGICRRIQMMVQQWSAAEYSLAIAKSTLANNAASIISAITRKFRDSQRQVGTGARRTNFCNESRRGLRRIVFNAEPPASCLAANRAFGSEADVRQYCLAQAQQDYSLGLDRMDQACEGVESDVVQRDRSDEIRQNFLLMQANVEATIQSFRDLIQNDCDPNQPVENCLNSNGQPNEFSRLRARYRNLVDRARRHCPSIRTPMVLEETSLRINLANAPSGRATQSSGPNLFQRFGDYIESWFTSI